MIVLWAVAVLVLPLAEAAEGPLGLDGAKAYQIARAADDTAQAARDEGEGFLTQLQKLVAASPDAEPLKALQTEAASAQQALLSYRRQVEASVTEVFQLLADLTRGSGTTPPDSARRQVLQQRALLAAHEAALMAARARTEAERLRALNAEARAALAGGRGRDSGSAGTAGAAPVRAAAPGEVLVPNLVGARLDAATRDLVAAGLRLGAATGPPEGFVVKQVPEAGTPVARHAAVSVTLSATAAGVTVGPSQ